jgi:hypothetical protein
VKENAREHYPTKNDARERLVMNITLSTRRRLFCKAALMLLPADMVCKEGKPRDALHTGLKKKQEANN